MYIVAIILILITIYAYIYNDDELNNYLLHFLNNYHIKTDTSTYLNHLLLYGFILYYLFGSFLTYIYYKYPKQRSCEIINNSISLTKTIIITLTNVLLTIFFLEFINFELYPIINFKPHVFLFQLIASLFISDFYSYIVHRLFHTPLFYKYIHKYHHYYKSPFALSAISSHPIEHIFFNIIAILIPIFLTKINFISSMIIMTFIIFNILTAHAGLKILDNGHNYHHVYNNVEYGLLITDIIFKTSYKNKKM